MNENEKKPMLVINYSVVDGVVPEGLNTIQREPDHDAPSIEEVIEDIAKRHGWVVGEVD